MRIDGKIHIPGKKYKVLGPGSEPVIRVSADAYNKLVEIVNGSTLSMAKCASTIILQGAELIVYDREDGCND